MNRYQTQPRGLGHVPTKRSRTGVLGVGFASFLRDGKLVSYFTANARTVRKFNIKRLGRHEAFRRALKCRAAFERKGAAI